MCLNEVFVSDQCIFTPYAACILSISFIELRNIFLSNVCEVNSTKIQSNGTKKNAC